VCWWLQLPTCQRVYNKTSPDCDSRDSSVASNYLGLLYHTKEEVIFFYHWRNVGSNPDLAFVSFGQDSRLPDRRVLGKFPSSQHWPSLITLPTLKVPAHSGPVKCWNFRKAGWKRFCLLTDESLERLLPPNKPNIERAYRDFCDSLLSTAKRCIPCGRRMNYVPCWDKECETLQRSFIRGQVGTDFDRAAFSLPSRLRQKKQWRWEEAKNSIDFSLSSHKGWRTFNKLTGRSGLSFRQCPILANSIASKLVKTERTGPGFVSPTGWSTRSYPTYWGL